MNENHIKITKSFDRWQCEIYGISRRIVTYTWYDCAAAQFRLAGHSWHLIQASGFQPGLYRDPLQQPNIT